MSKRQKITSIVLWIAAAVFVFMLFYAPGKWPVRETELRIPSGGISEMTFDDMRSQVLTALGLKRGTVEGLGYLHAGRDNNGNLEGFGHIIRVPEYGRPLVFFDLVYVPSENSNGADNGDTGRLTLSTARSERSYFIIQEGFPAAAARPSSPYKVNPDFQLNWERAVNGVPYFA